MATFGHMCTLRMLVKSCMIMVVMIHTIYCYVKCLQHGMTVNVHVKQTLDVDTNITQPLHFDIQFSIVLSAVFGQLQRRKYWFLWSTILACKSTTTELLCSATLDPAHDRKHVGTCPNIHHDRQLIVDSM